MKFILPVLLALMSVETQAQDFIVGAKLGIGYLNYKNQATSNSLDGYATTQAGISLEYSPYFSRMLIVSGLSFESSKLGNEVTVPFGIRILFGEKFRPYTELGGYYSVNLKTKQDDYILKNHTGARVGMGLLYIVDKRIRFDAGYFMRFGLNTALEEEIELPANQFDYDRYNAFSGNLEIVIKYRF